MNGIDNITSRIESETEAKCKDIIDRATYEASEIKKSFSEIAKRESDAILEKGKRAADERVLRLNGVAQLEARKMSLRTKQQMIDLAFSNALEELSKLSVEDYIATLARLAVKASVTGNEEIILSASDREKHGKSVVAAANKLLLSGDSTASNRFDKVFSAAEKLISHQGFKLSDETRDIRGGLILKEASLEINCTFETIIRLMRDELAGEVAGILFS